MSVTPPLGTPMTVHTHELKDFWGRFCRNSDPKSNKKTREMKKTKKFGYFVVKTICPRDVSQRRNLFSEVTTKGAPVSILWGAELGCYDITNTCENISNANWALFYQKVHANMYLMMP